MVVMELLEVRGNYLKQSCSGQGGVIWNQLVVIMELLEVRGIG